MTLNECSRNQDTCQEGIQCVETIGLIRGSCGTSFPNGLYVQMKDMYV